MTFRPNIYHQSGLSLVWLSAALLFELLPSHSTFGQELLLRDGQLIPHQSIEAADFRGIRLKDEKTFGWNEVLDVQPSDPENFSRWIRGRGLVLARINQRLEIKDLEGARALAAADFTDFVLQPYLQESGDAPLEQAAGLAKLAADQEYRVAVLALQHWQDRGENERALSALIEACRRHPEISQLDHDPALATALPDPVVQSGFSPRVLPIWSSNASETTWKALLGQLENLETKQSLLPAGFQLYRVSLLLRLNRNQEAAVQLARIEPLTRRPDAPSWLGQAIATLQMQLNASQNERVPKLGPLPDADSTDESKLAWELVDLYHRTNLRLEHQLSTKDRQRDKLQEQIHGELTRLLVIPAIGEAKFPGLSAAALAQATDFAKRMEAYKTQAILRAELLRTFPNTYHAELMVD